MAEVLLSVANIRALRDNMKQLSRDLTDRLTVEIEQATSAVVAGDVIENIAGIADVDGNYDGTDSPTVVVEVGLRGHDVIWRGKQIAFVEFGTGAVGSGYPSPAMLAAGYSPDPTKDRWVYMDAKSNHPEWSHGLPFQAPMYKAAAQARVSGLLKQQAARSVRRAVQRAVDV